MPSATLSLFYVITRFVPVTNKVGSTIIPTVKGRELRNTDFKLLAQGQRAGQQWSQDGVYVVHTWSHCTTEKETLAEEYREKTHQSAKMNKLSITSRINAYIKKLRL